MDYEDSNLELTDSEKSVFVVDNKIKLNTTANNDSSLIDNTSSLIDTLNNTSIEPVIKKDENRLAMIQQFLAYHSLAIKQELEKNKDLKVHERLFLMELSLNKEKN